MITKKAKLLEILSDKKWHDKGDLCNELTYLGLGYADSTARELRKMESSGLIEKKQNEDKKGTSYRIKREYSTNYTKLQKLVNERKEREALIPKQQTLL